MSDRLLVVEGLQVTYYTAEASLEALHDVSFSVRAGEIVGVVGESGCGKSTLSASLMGVLPANGEITTDGARLQNAITLTHRTEWVSSQASQSVATRCIHEPVQQVTLPA